jgi:hypothetical protein
MRFRVTEVTATFAHNGWPIPTSVRWDSVTLPIVDIGRRWREDDGIHILVRVPDGRVFELHTNGSLWRAAVVSEPPHYA